jgi:diguanylate cyclase (GGDEF)-like protein
MDRHEPAGDQQNHPLSGNAEARRLKALLERSILTILILGGAIVAYDLPYLQATLLQGGVEAIDGYISLGTLAILAGAYLLSRRGHFRSSAVTTVLAITLAIFAVSIPSPSLNDVGMLYFIVIPVLFSGLLLGFRFSLALGIAVILGMLLVDLLVPTVPSEEVPILTTMIIVGMVLFAARHRQLMERDRYAAITASQERYRYLATHDPLTGLPNRTLLHERLQSALRRAHRNSLHTAVLFLDLDNFKQVNDAFEHHAGDRLLTELGERLRRALRETDTVARMGGDEFAVILEELTNPFDSIAVVQKLLEAVPAPCNIRGKEISITTSVGISIYPKDARDVDELLQQADTALSYAKHSGKNAFRFYNEEMALATAEKLTIARELRSGVSGGQFFPVYQAQVSSSSGTVVGFEALARWHHPQRGVLNPGFFLPVAEESGLIEEIGSQMLTNACHQLAVWQREGYPLLKMAVNLSRAQLHNSSLLSVVAEAIETSGIPPGSLELELTENILFEESGQAAQLLRGLAELGVSLALDDFGAGYATLKQLALFPINVLKLDRRFAEDISTNRRDAAVVKGIAGIASDLGLTTVAEGIETAEQLRAYRSYGFDIIQGYYFSRPLPAGECRQILTKGSFGIAESH